MKKLIVVLAFFFATLPAFSQSLTDTTLQTKPSLTERLVGGYLDNLNYYTITLFMTIESSFIPFPSEIVVPPAAYGACDPANQNLYVTDNKFINILIVILFATVGAILGALINYFLALFLGRPIIYWFVETRVGKMFLLSKPGIEKAENYFVKNGNISTLVGRLIPAIRQLISIPAGLAKMKMGPFLLFTTLGATLWNTILAILGYFAHGQKDLINKYSHELTIILAICGVLFLIYLIYKGIKKK
ncbi:MAG: DedA family protein [Bacteroidetes bacterium]|nr:DedA family protein [Bacteroidota bacterium]